MLQNPYERRSWPIGHFLLGRFFVLIAALASLAQPAFANGPIPARTGAPSAGATGCAEQVARTVQARYEAVRDLDARFVQRTRSVVLGGNAAGGATTAEGRVIFAKPARMRWHYETPQESLVISDGETLWLVDPVAEEAQRMPVTAGFLSGAALSFLVGEGDLLAQFAVSAPADVCGAGQAEIELVPREDAGYEKLLLRADASTGDVVAATVLDLFGNETEVEFHEMRINLGPAATTFRFTPAPGFDVIDLEAAPGGAP